MSNRFLKSVLKYFSTENKSQFSLASNLKNTLLQRHIGMQMQHTYNIEENRNFIIPNKLDNIAFYGSPTYTFNLDAFTRFNTMEEVIKEFVTDLQLGKKEGESYFRIFDRFMNALHENDPLILIDGVQVKMQIKLCHLIHKKIKIIDVVSSKYLYWPAIYDGTISIKTYDGDAA